MDETTGKDNAHPRIDVEQLAQASDAEIAATAAAVRTVLQPFEDLIKTVYDQARAYTNAIILAGYAAFFAIWSFTRAMVPDRPELLAALLMLISCSVFVAWEVVQMIIRTWTLLGITAACGDGDPEAPRRLAEYANKNATTGTVRATIIAWSVVLIITVCSGVSAAGILVWAFVVELWQGLATPAG